MDQGILEALKRRYKKNLLYYLILENEASSLTIPEIVKQLSIKDAVYWSAQAWEDTSSLSLAKAWKKLLPPVSPDMPAVSDTTDEEPTNFESFSECRLQ